METIGSFIGEYRFLSNFWYNPVNFEGEIYPTNEHAFQAAKTLSKLERLGIRAADSPGKAKKLGQSVTLRPDWQDIKLDTMDSINFQKFSASPYLRAKLIATGDAELIEGNVWNDIYWGVCNGVGENHLGKILMNIRDELRKD